MDIFRRHNVSIRGQGARVLVLAHGFGCDQNMWRFVTPAFEPDHRVVLFDHIGCGRADIGAYDPKRHATLEGYAEDVNNLLDGLGLSEVVFVGHSVSAMIGLLAAIRQPGRFARLVMVCPSPRYLNDPPDYVGGFERADIEGLLHMMETNMLGWADFLAPAVMGEGSAEALTLELRDSFCATDPYVTRRFAQATFLSDNRADLPRCPVPSLVIQCHDDAIAPTGVGRYVHEHTPGSTLALIEATGHCPHMTHPQQTIAAIRRYLQGVA
jgi:sigma-B regulation protein RsbQ